MRYTDKKRKLTAQRLKWLRNNKGLTYSQLHTVLSTEYETAYPSIEKLKELEMYRDHKAGYKKGFGTRVDYLCTLADFYGVSIAYLLGETDIKSPDANMRTVSKLTGLSENALNKLFSSTQTCKNAINDILEKSPKLLSSLAQYIYANLLDTNTVSVKGVKYTLPPEMTDIILLAEIKNDVIYLRDKIEKAERKPEEE